MPVSHKNAKIEKSLLFRYSDITCSGKNGTRTLLNFNNDVNFGS